MNSIYIAPDRRIGPGLPCLVIAEAGVNHNGDIEIAKELIHAAARAGADVVKFQTFRAEKLVTREAKMANYQVQNTGKSQSQLDMLKALELPFEAHAELKALAESMGLIFLSTPFDEEALDFLHALGVVMFKVGSGDLTNIPFLKRMGAKGLPVILSTGMATLEEAREAVDAIRSVGNEQIVVLHCTTSYPCPIETVNLRAMESISTALTVHVGYSDHTEGIEIPALAVAAGACVIEKHFTLDRNMSGPDHKASLEPDELKAMVQAIRRVDSLLGTGFKAPLAAELEIGKVARKSVVAVQNIPAGAVITEDMIAIKRPGTGLHPRHYYDLLGKVTLRAIDADTLISFSDVETKNHPG
jgi:N-acetylneuraminate synthase